MSELETGQFESEEEKLVAEKFEEQQDRHRKSKIFLGRHGESKHNIAEIPYFAGGSLEQDTPLIEKGIESAKKVAERLKSEDIDVLISSDLKRARETAEVIAQELGGQIQIVELEGLREVHVGELTGKTREQVRQGGSEEAKQALEDFLSGDIRRINFPGGDSYETACQRVRESLDKIIQQYGDKARIAIVGHGNINKVILSLMFPDDIGFINQLDLAHENVVELDMELDEENNPQFNNVKLHGEGEDKGLI